MRILLGEINRGKGDTEWQKALAKARLNVSVVSVAACLRDISIIPDIIEGQQHRNPVKTARPMRRKCDST
jgi:CTP:molybdopterin cytidylyltransferase MocA